MGEDAQPWEDDGSLPLDAEGSLPFYFIDAHEEASTSGTVYMFGKVLSHCLLCQSPFAAVHRYPTPMLRGACRLSIHPQ
jgi:hypothetical protein